MNFALGVIAGILLCIFDAVSRETRSRIVESVESLGKPKGSVIELKPHGQKVLEELIEEDV